MACQILALRRVVPAGAGTVPVSAVVITGAILGLGLGYRIASRWGPDRRKVCALLAGAGGWACWALSGPAAEDVFVLGDFLGWHVVASAMLYTLLYVMPEVGCLGAAAVGLIAYGRQARSEEDAGQALWWSCIGNTGAGLLTATVWMAWVGVAGAQAVACAALAAAAVIAAPKEWRGKAWTAAAAIAAGSGIGVWHERTTLTAATAYGDYRILDDGSERTLEMNNQVASKWTPHGTGHRYVEAIESTLESNGIGRGILVIGAAGATVGQGRDMDVTFADVDGAAVRLAEALSGERPARFHAEDGRALLRRSPKRWKAIVVDAYQRVEASPEHLVTVEFFQLARERLEDGGLLVLNVVRGDRDGRFQRRLQRTLRSVFDEVEVEDPNRGNRLLWARRTPGDGDRTVYSDTTGQAAMDAGLETTPRTRERTREGPG